MGVYIDTPRQTESSKARGAATSPTQASPSTSALTTEAANAPLRARQTRHLALRPVRPAKGSAPAPPSPPTSEQQRF